MMLSRTKRISSRVVSIGTPLKASGLVIVSQMCVNSYSQKVFVDTVNCQIQRCNCSCVICLSVAHVCARMYLRANVMILRYLSMFITREHFSARDFYPGHGTTQPDYVGRCVVSACLH